ncbi:hypothetical protein [Streptomyces graminilatus]|uniref:hypothetical protein n=1 Tax=Streptomyces graminilatus TaxID=1464070 RepID=UPI0006E267B9|nr:hypothetical protein [Streptomyces graminilatus]
MTGRSKAAARQDHDALETSRARYGLLAVITSNVAIACVAIFGVWRLHGDSAVVVGILTAAFTAVSTMTTAYLGIKAVSNTAKSIALGDTSARTTPQASPLPPVSEPQPLPVPAQPGPSTASTDPSDPSGG